MSFKESITVNGESEFMGARGAGGFIFSYSVPPLFRCSIVPFFRSAFRVLRSAPVSYIDYYPFGYPIAERSGSLANYRFGFGGQESDNDNKQIDINDGTTKEDLLSAKGVGYDTEILKKVVSEHMKSKIKYMLAGLQKAKGGYINHNFGLAMGIAIFGENGNYLKKGTEWQYSFMGKIGKTKMELEWGGDWKEFFDPSHFQDMQGYSIKQLRNLPKTKDGYVIFPK
jgi:hypothetical protein